MLSSGVALAVGDRDTVLVRELEGDGDVVAVSDVVADSDTVAELVQEVLAVGVDVAVGVG